MTDTKPTPRTDAVKAEVEKDKDRLPYADFLFRMVGELSNHARELERELAAIKSQPVPVEPHFLGQCSAEYLLLRQYIDALKSALQVAQQERDEKRLQWQNWRSRMGLTASATELLERAEKADAENAELRKAIEICRKEMERRKLFGEANFILRQRDEALELAARECDSIAWSNKNTAMLGPEYNSTKCAAAIRKLKVE